MQSNQRSRGRFSRHVAALVVSTVLASSFLVVGIQGVASATSTISHVSGFPLSVETAGNNQIGVTPQHVGDLVVLDSQIHSQSITVSSVSSTGGIAGPWHFANRYLDTTNGVITEEVWWATASGTTASTITVTYSGTISSLPTPPELVADSFTTSGGAATWSFIAGGGNAGSNTSGITFPSLTSDQVDASQLYWGYVESTKTAVVGGTTNFQYATTPNGNLSLYNDQLSLNTAYAPTATATPPGNFSAIGAIFAATSSAPSGSTVTFDGNGGTGAMGPETANTATLLTPNNFVRTGYTFAGWDTSSAGTTVVYANDASYPFTASATLYAVWTANTNYTVTFNGNGATSGSMSNETNNVPTALTSNAYLRTGYTFAGWDTSSAGTTVVYANDASYPFTASATLYAVWTANQTVTFNGNGATSGSMSAETSGVPAPLTSNAYLRTGYTFAGWDTSSAGTTVVYANDASYPFTASATLYAVWTANTNYTVTFNGNGATSGSMSNETNNVPTALTSNAYLRTGYTFAGWDTSSAGTTVVYANDASYPFTASATLYAVWTANTSYMVTFNGNGNTGGSMGTQTASAPTALTPNAFVKSGYVFSAWTTLPSGGSSYGNGAIFPFTAPTTLYAQWSLPVVGPPVVGSSGFTVNFFGNGATSGAMSPETGNAPAALTADSFVRTGYTFAGWNTVANGGGTSYADGATYPFAANAILYAQWTAPAHTVTFVGNGATSGTTSSETNSAPSPLTGNAFTRAGFTFAGWNTAANGAGTVYANGATYPFSADLTLYAQWTADFNTVTFIGNGANHGSMKSQVANVPTALTTNVFTRTGYTFAGWNTAANGTGTKYINHENYSFDAKLNLFAQWTRILNPAPRAIRIVGTFAAGTTHMVMIVGTALVGTAKVLTNAPGTTINILNVKNTHIDARVTVKKGTRPGVHVLTIVLHNGKSCTISYLSR